MHFNSITFYQGQDRQLQAHGDLNELTHQDSLKENY